MIYNICCNDLFCGNELLNFYQKQKKLKNHKRIVKPQNSLLVL